MKVIAFAAMMVAASQAVDIELAAERRSRGPRPHFEGAMSSLSARGNGIESGLMNASRYSGPSGNSYGAGAGPRGPARGPGYGGPSRGSYGGPSRGSYGGQSRGGYGGPSGPSRGGYGGPAPRSSFGGNSRAGPTYNGPQNRLGGMDSRTPAGPTGHGNHASLGHSRYGARAQWGNGRAPNMNALNGNPNKGMVNRNGYGGSKAPRSAPIAKTSYGGSRLSRPDQAMLSVGTHAGEWNIPTRATVKPQPTPSWGAPPVPNVKSSTTKNSNTRTWGKKVEMPKSLEADESDLQAELAKWGGAKVATAADIDIPSIDLDIPAATDIDIPSVKASAPAADAEEADEEPKEDLGLKVMQEGPQWGGLGEPTVVWHPEVEQAVGSEGPSNASDPYGGLKSKKEREQLEIKALIWDDEADTYKPPEDIDWDTLYRTTKRNPWTGQYWGRMQKEAREERSRPEREAYFRDARAEREGRAAREERPEYSSENVQAMPNVAPKADPRVDAWGNQLDYSPPEVMDPFSMESPYSARKEFGVVDDDMFNRFGVDLDPDVPGLEHEPVYLPKYNQETGELLPVEEKIENDLPECEEGDEDCEEPEEKPEKEPYMTKQYYMPGYVDQEAEKLYPPHIRMFKDYIGTIGDFKKHGYEKQDYSPDSSQFAPDSSGFGPDRESMAVNEPFRKPTGTQYGSDFGGFDYRPEETDYRDAFSTDVPNFQPESMDYRGDFSNDIGSFRPDTPEDAGYRPAEENYRTAFNEDVDQFRGHRVDYNPEQDFDPENDFDVPDEDYRQTVDYTVPARDEFERPSHGYRPAEEDYRLSVDYTVPDRDGFERPSHGFALPDEDYRLSVDYQVPARDGFEKPTHGYRPEEQDYRLSVDYQVPARDGFEKPTHGYRPADEDYRLSVDYSVPARDDFNRPSHGFDVPAQSFRPDGPNKPSIDRSFDRPSASYSAPDQTFRPAGPTKPSVTPDIHRPDGGYSATRPDFTPNVPNKPSVDRSFSRPSSSYSASRPDFSYNQSFRPQKHSFTAPARGSYGAPAQNFKPTQSFRPSGGSFSRPSGNSYGAPSQNFRPQV